MTEEPQTKRASRKRILILTERFYPEDFTINDLACELQKKGLEFDILTQQPSYPHGSVSAYPGYSNKLFSVDFWNNMKIYRIMTIQGYRKSKIRKLINYFHFAFLCSWVILFKGRKYGKIFVFHSGPLTMALPAMIGKKFFGTVNIIWSLDLWPDTVFYYGFKRSALNESLLDFLVKKIYRQFDAIYCSSPGFVDRLQHYAGDKPIRTLLQWPQITRGVGVKGVVILDPDKFHFTFAGNIAWTQNLENVILGFFMAQQKIPGIMLNIFGEGSDLERLKRIVADREIPHVIFRGWKPLEEMPAVYEQSQVLVVSLQADPVYERYIPLKFSTYLAFGKPIFAILNGIVKKLTENNDIGIAACPSSPGEISRGFETLASMDRQQLSRIGENSSSLLADRFDREKNINIIFDALKSW